jgi:hypothetical protein
MRIRRPVGWGTTMLTAAVIGAGIGCADKDSGFEVPGGVGLRVQLPAGVDTLDWVDVELWKKHIHHPVPCPGLDISPDDRPLASPQPENCTRKTVEIWNLLGERVRYLESSPNPNRSFKWDQRDDNGELVPRGFYFTLQKCVEGLGLEFEGTYYVRTAEDDATLQWIIWSRRIAPDQTGRMLEFSPFPEFFQKDWIRPIEGGGCASERYSFGSPYILRVRAPGMKTFEGIVNFVQFKFTEASVEFAPQK